MPRLFTGLKIPGDIAADLALMRGGIIGGKWIDPESYHITLRFIGDVEMPLAREIAFALEKLQVKPFSLSLRGIDAWGGKKPHSIVALAEPSEPLLRLHQTQERIMQSLGMPADPRRFTPHVTLARLREPELHSLHGFLSGHNPYVSRDFALEHFVLFSSRPSRGGGPYAVEEVYPFLLEGQQHPYADEFIFN